MHIEVTPAMREAVKRVKEAQSAYGAGTPVNFIFIELLKELLDARADAMDLVIAAIEEQEKKNAG